MSGELGYDWSERVGDTAHLVSPRRQVASERGNDPESEWSRFASCRRIVHRSSFFVSGTLCPVVIQRGRPA
jgi:hypothetical protein